MVFDFAARPPEINSTLIYTGAGAGPMMAAAASFGNLSSELATNAAAYESVISQLTGSEWQGPSSTAMAASAQQNVEWLQTTSAQLAEAAAKATASAAAYEAAFSASIPPPVVYANRAQLAILVATNILGQNTPAIAANEAMYGEFWAQDATAMSAYAAAAATASQVTPLQEPVQSTNPGGSAAQGAAVANAANSNAANTGTNQLLGQLTNASAAAAQPGAAPAATIGDLWNAIQGTAGIPLFSNGFNSFDVTLSWCIMMMASALGTLNHFTAGAPFGVTIGDVEPLGAGLGFGTTLAGSSSGLGGGATLAGMGTAAEVGGMSVPAGWSAAAPAAATEATLAGSGWTAAADTAVTGTGGAPGIMPGMASAGGKAGMGIGGPRYGVKPRVMPTKVLV
jgi:PPE-repeat protein